MGPGIPSHGKFLLKRNLHGTGDVHQYFIAANEVEWDYTPSAMDMCGSEPVKHPIPQHNKPLPLIRDLLWSRRNIQLLAQLPEYLWMQSLEKGRLHCKRYGRISTILLSLSTIDKK